MKFVGNMAESYAMNYKHRVFTHSETARGRVVNYYDCFISDEIPPEFPEDSLNKDKVRRYDKFFKKKEDEYNNDDY